MSNPPNGYNTDVSFNKFKGSYFNDDVDVSGGDLISRTGNLYLAPNSSIFTENNQIQFNEEFQFCDFANNVNVLGQLKNSYNSVEYDVGLQCEKTDTLVDDVATLSPIVSDTAYKCTGFYWDAGLSSTIFNNNASFPNASISSTAINNTSFVSKSGAETIDGIKTFNSAPVMSGASITNLSIPVGKITGTAVNLSTAQTITSTKSYSVVQNFNNNIRLDGSLLVGTAGNVVLVNSTLQKIAFISDTTSAVGANLTSLQNQINSINTNSALLSSNNVFTGSNSFNGNLNVTTFNSSVQINNGFGALYNNAVQFVFYPTQTTFSNGSAGENVFEFTSNNTDRGFTFQGGKGSDGRSLFGMYYLSGSFANPVNRLPIMYGRDTGTQANNILTIASGTLATSSITFSGTLNNISTTLIGYLSGLTENIKTSLDSLSSRTSTVETKNTAISYTSETSTTTISNNLVFTGTLNNIIPTVFSYLSNLSGNIQDQINNLSARIANVEIVGTIIMSPLNDLQTTTSNKYLMCNGQSVSRTTYSALFAKFDTLFGVGDGSSTFNIPNYNGLFLRSMGNQIINGTNYGNYNSTYAPDQDSVQDHTHAGQAGSYLGTLNSTQTIGYRPQSSSSPNSYTFATTGAMNSGRINAFETKPVSIGIYYYVRT